MRTFIVIFALALAFTGSALGANFTKRTLSDAHVGTTKTELRAQMSFSQRQERFFANHHWMVAARHSTCWSHVPWAKTCNTARKHLRLHRHLYAIAKSRYDRLFGFPIAYDWLTAISVVQRWFPGTSGWLYSCSSGEGGHGGWVSNTQGSGAGGWMQYMSSTFYGDFADAASYLAARGVRVPSSLDDWKSAEGQAIAAGWARATGHTPSGKWTGGGC